MKFSAGLHDIWGDAPMATAVSLATENDFACSPNPTVGCVILSAKGAVIGKGQTKEIGRAHV